MSNMNILVVAATLPEIQPMLIFLKEDAATSKKVITSVYNSVPVDILITGIGMVASSYHLGKTLQKNKYDLCINLGLAGSFNKRIKIGDVVNITRDCFSELGAEDDSRFISFEEFNKENNNIHEHLTSVVSSFPLPQKFSINSLQSVKGITVNTVHGNERSIEKIKKRLRPDVESMEGAAFMYCCFQEKIPCMQIRAVSNYVEKRNKNKWNIPLAINNLNQKALEIVGELSLCKSK